MAFDSAASLSRLAAPDQTAPSDAAARWENGSSTMAYQDFLLDKRIVQRNLDKGLVDGKQLDKLIASLPDRADNAAATSLETDDGGDEAEGSDE